MKYITTTGIKIEAENEVELVTKLRKMCIITPTTNNEYMHQTCGRCVLYYGFPIKYDTEKNFVNDLLKIKELKEVT